MSFTDLGTMTVFADEPVFSTEVRRARDMV
jgi:hypothetical protein